MSGKEKLQLVFLIVGILAAGGAFAIISHPAAGLLVVAGLAAWVVFSLDD